MSDGDDLEERLQLIKEKRLSRSGLVLYRLGSDHQKLPKNSMELVENYYN